MSELQNIVNHAVKLIIQHFNKVNNRLQNISSILEEPDSHFSSHVKKRELQVVDLKDNKKQKKFEEENWDCAAHNIRTVDTSRMNSEDNVADLKCSDCDSACMETENVNHSTTSRNNCTTVDARGVDENENDDDFGGEDNVDDGDGNDDEVLSNSESMTDVTVTFHKTSTATASSSTAEEANFR